MTFIFDAMQQCGSLTHGRAVARDQADKAAALLDTLDFLQAEVSVRPGEQWDEPVVDRRFLKELINYVIYRNL